MKINAPQLEVNGYNLAPPSIKEVSGTYTVVNSDHLVTLVAGETCDGVTFGELKLGVRVVLFNASGAELVVGGNFNADVAGLPNFANFEAIHIGEGNWIVI